MMARILFIFIISSFIFDVLGQHGPTEKMSNRSKRIKNLSILKNSSLINMDVRLIQLPSATRNETGGIITIKIPPIESPFSVCYPRENPKLQQLLFLSHAICRQLGFMSFTDVERKMAPPHVLPSNDSSSHFPMGLVSGSWSCTGHEQAISQCSWNNITAEECSIVTGVTCGACHKTINSRGFIKTPGFPYAYLFDLTCEWSIEIPESQHIILDFYISYMGPANRSSTCADDEPYIEIVYGVQGNYNIQRRCDFWNLKNLSIPSNEVKIRFFSGLHSPKDRQVDAKYRGFEIFVTAVPVESFDFLTSGTIVMVVITAMAFLLAPVICYCFVFKLFRNRGSTNTQVDLHPNAPGIEDLERAVEFQRCQIQNHQKDARGLRMRSNNSAQPNLSKVFFPSSTVSLPFFHKNPSQNATPRTIIPHVVETNQYRGLKRLSMLKAKLLDRFSGSSESKLSQDGGCTTPEVFLSPGNAPLSFEIYHSVSDEKPKDTKISMDPR